MRQVGRRVIVNISIRASMLFQYDYIFVKRKENVACVILIFFFRNLRVTARQVVRLVSSLQACRSMEEDNFPISK